LVEVRAGEDGRFLLPRAGVPAAIEASRDGYVPRATRATPGADVTLALERARRLAVTLAAGPDARPLALEALEDGGRPVEIWDLAGTVALRGARVELVPGESRELLLPESAATVRVATQAGETVREHALGPYAAALQRRELP
jgi:hypothetical protein